MRPAPMAGIPDVDPHRDQIRAEPPGLAETRSVLAAADAVAAALGLRRVRAAIRPQPLVDRHRLAVVGVAAAAMLPAAGFGSWLVQAEVHDRVPQVITGLVLGATACFGVVLAALLGRFDAAVAAVRSRLAR